MVRCKVRCLNTTQTWEGFAHAELRPVKTGASPDAAEDAENRRFWKWTPSGEVSLRWKRDAVPDDAKKIDVGAFYYLDLETAQVDVARWNLARIEQTDSRLEVELHMSYLEKQPEAPSFTGGTIKLGIDNKDAWAPFLSAGIGSAWMLTLTRCG